MTECASLVESRSECYSAPPINPDWDWARACDYLSMIHRHDGTIAVVDSHFKSVFLRAAELRTGFLPFAERLALDSFYAINGFRAGTQRRRAYAIEFLTSLFVDVDFGVKINGKRGVPDENEIESGIARVWPLFAKRVVPMPSIIVRSGRGFWLLWLLKQSSELIRAADRTAEKFATWTRLQEEISGRLSEHLPVDAPVSRDVSHLTRIPGSLNSKAGCEVVYTLNAGADGRPLIYTMAELAGRLGVPEHSAYARPDVRGVAEPRLKLLAGTALASQSRPARSPRGPRYAERAASGASGQRALRLRRLYDFETLVNLRGGEIFEGHRNYFALILAYILRSAPDRVERLMRFGREQCIPPLEDGEIRAALKFQPRERGLKDTTIGAMLRITTDENQHHLTGEYLTPKPSEAAAKVERRKRREVIGEVCVKGVLSLRKIQKALAQSYGISASVETIRCDLQAMEISNPRAESGNPGLFEPAALKPSFQEISSVNP